MKPKDQNLKYAVILGPKVMKVIETLAKQTGHDPNTVLTKALGLYKMVKEKEREGYFPAVVKDGKATPLTGT